MSYLAKTFNVMIASPGDVNPERTIAREVIHEWNALYSSQRRIVLLPIGWETHSTPQMGAHPQEIINRQLLPICDLMIGVFWTRIGTPTTEYASGTVEEIEKHMASGKPAMLYFSSQPAALDSADLDQVAKVKEFKKSCESRGLYVGYENYADFKDKFYRNLQQTVNNHLLFQADVSENSDASQTHSSEIVESQTLLPDLSLPAKVLLKEASLDKHGNVIYLRFLGGTDIQTNGKKINESYERREIAKWEHALDELVDIGLLVPRGNKGEVFDITDAGYRVADMISF